MRFQHEVKLSGHEGGSRETSHGDRDRDWAAERHERRHMETETETELQRDMRDVTWRQRQRLSCRETWETSHGDRDRDWAAERHERRHMETETETELQRDMRDVTWRQRPRLSCRETWETSHGDRDRDWAAERHERRHMETETETELQRDMRDVTWRQRPRLSCRETWEMSHGDRDRDWAAERHERSHMETKTETELQRDMRDIRDMRDVTWRQRPILSVSSWLFFSLLYVSHLVSRCVPHTLQPPSVSLCRLVSALWRLISIPLSHICQLVLHHRRRLHVLVVMTSFFKHTTQMRWPIGNGCINMTSHAHTRSAVLGSMD